MHACRLDWKQLVDWLGCSHCIGILQVSPYCIDALFPCSRWGCHQAWQIHKLKCGHIHLHSAECLCKLQVAIWLCGNCGLCLPWTC